MFKKILIANRGEIALRIIRTCEEMGIQSVAVYSKADANELFVRLSSEAYCIGSENALQSYLNMETILHVALKTKCDAIHPGYGFLAENADFADKCNKAGIKFIGPSVQTMKKMANKTLAKTLMKENKIPVIPGNNSLLTEQNLEGFAEEIGYPVIIKASGGGGGRGIRKVFSKNDLISSYQAAKTEAQLSFNDDRMYLEKLIINPCHIEFQILSDTYGNIVHLGERDCSIQRKNQKIIEECPAPSILDEIRQKMSKIAIKVAKIVDYEGAGTVEFIIDQNENFYFMEMNTRIQVEHPVTEMAYGIDLIKEQILVASGEGLSFKQNEIILRGCAIECRVNAEDPNREFIPSTGIINEMILPGGIGVRVDSLLYKDCMITSYYDSLIAKIIVWGKDREEAVRRMQRALKEFEIQNFKSNIGLLKYIIGSNFFVEGKYSINTIEKLLLENEKIQEI